MAKQLKGGYGTSTGEGAEVLGLLNKSILGSGLQNLSKVDKYRQLKDMQRRMSLKS